LCSAIAAPTSSADASKPFKIAVTIGSKTVYLTKTTTASENIADGVTCTIADKADTKGVITCDGNLGYYYNDKHPLEGTIVPVTLEAAQKLEASSALYKGYATSNQNWSIGADNSLKWKSAQTGPTGADTVHFSKSMFGADNKIYAEICSTYNHPDGSLYTVGATKAVYV
jgi:hypothetical protein